MPYIAMQCNTCMHADPNAPSTDQPAKAKPPS
jgi:hypothetical protein